jgi:hypothetical protein
MPKYILAAVQSKKNSAKTLIDSITCSDDKKAYLPGLSEKCAESVLRIIELFKPEVFVIFNQMPLKGEIRIEIIASTECGSYVTNYDYNLLSKYLKDLGYNVNVSSKLTCSLSNTVYAKGLHYIEQNKAKTQFLYIHIPVLINKRDLFALSNVLKYFFEGEPMNGTA